MQHHRIVRVQRLADIVKRLEDGKRVAIDVNVGDRILFGKYSSSDIKVDGEEDLIMREDEILGVVEREPKAEKQPLKKAS